MGSMSVDLVVETPSGTRHWSEAELAALASGDRLAVGELLPADPGATHASFESRGGDYRASIPLDVARGQGVVLIGEGEGLRLLVEDGDTLCWNVKDLSRIRLTFGAEPDSVPENPPH